MLGKIKSFLFVNQSAKQTVLKNAVWLLGGEATSRLIRAVIVIVSARVLGAAEYGAFAYAMAIAGFLTIFADIGLSSVLTREAVKSPELRKKYFATAFAVKIGLVFINVALVFFVAPLLTKIEAARALLPLIAFIIIFDTLREFGFGLNRALEKMEREALVKVITNLAIVGFGFFLLFKLKSAFGLAIAYLVGSGIGFLLTVWILRAYLKDLKAVDKKLILPILSVAWPIGLLAVLGAIMINTDMVMLGFWLSAQEVGYYASAQKIIQLLYIFPTLLASAAFPIFTRLAQFNPDRFRQVLEKVVSGAIAAATPIAIGGVLLSSQIINLLYGAEYLPAANAFAILSTTILIVYPSVIITNGLFAFNEQKQFAAFVAIGAFSNAFFNYLLIPRYGIEGAAFATIGSQLLSNFFVWAKMRRLNGFKILPRLPKVIFASFLMGAILVSLREFLSAWALVLLGALAYFLLLIIFKEKLLLESFGAISHKDN